MFAELWIAERRQQTLLTGVAILWACVVFGILVRLAILSPESRTLFPIYRDAGSHWVEGHDLYPEALLGHADKLYRYSPTVAVLFTPLSVLPQKVGDGLWRVLSAAILISGLVAMARTLAGPNLDRRALAIFLALMIPPGLGHLSNGQCNAVVIGLILLGYAAAAHGRFDAAAACLAVATLFKLYPVAAAGLLAILSPRRFTWRYLVAMGIGLAVPFVLQNFDYVMRQYQLWIHYNLHEDRSTWTVVGTNVDFQLLLRVCGVSITLTAYRIVEMLAGVAMAAVCAFAVRAGRPANLTLTLALGLSCVWMTVFGPATESPTYLLLTPVVAWGVLTSWQSTSTSPRRQAIRWMMTCSYGLLVILQVAGIFGPLFYFLRGLCPQPIAGMIYLAALLWEMTCASDAESHAPK